MQFFAVLPFMLVGVNRHRRVMIAGSAATIAMLKDEQGPAWLAELGVRRRWVDVNGGSGGDWL